MRKFVQNAFGWFASEFIVSWLLPITATIGTAVVGWIQGVPLFHWLVGVILAFASISVGLLRFSEWRFRNRVKDKLSFENVFVNRNHDPSGFVNELTIGVLMRSTAPFPIQFQVAEVSTSFDTNIPRKTEYEKNKIEVPPEGIGAFDDHLIATGKKTNGIFEGKISARINYGKLGRRLNNSLEISKKLLLVFDANGRIESVNFYDQSI